MMNPEYISDVEHSLKAIDFEIPDEDALCFYIYVLANHYKQDLSFENEYRPPRYFKFLYKWIQPHLSLKV